MFPLPRFDYIAPRSLEEACYLLEEHKESVSLLAGGTDLLPSMKQRSIVPAYVIDLKSIPGLATVKESVGEKVIIGALTPLSAVADSEIIRKYFPGLAQAADSVASPQIRKMGTVGGNIALNTRCSYFNQSRSWLASFEPCFKRGGTLCHVVPGGSACHAFFAADTAIMLIALQASITITTATGTKQRPLESLFTYDGKAPIDLENTEVISAIQVPIPPIGNANVYKKLRLRRAVDFSLASCAVSLTVDGDRCKELRITLGALGPGPIVVKNVSNLVAGRKLTKNHIQEIAAQARSCAKPVANAALSPQYRRNMASVLTANAVEEALKKARTAPTKGYHHV